MTGGERKRSETVPTAAMPAASLPSTESLDLVVPPYCSLTDANKPDYQAIEDEITDRLSALNPERAREEERLGLTNQAKASATPSTTSDASPKPKRTCPEKPAGDVAPTKGQRDLFE